MAYKLTFMKKFLTWKFIFASFMSIFKMKLHICA